MRRLFLLAVLGFVGCGGSTSFIVPNPVQILITCPAGKVCSEYQVYRIQGECPSILKNSTGWEVVGTTKASKFVDSNVIYGQTYSYDVETLNGGSYSGPSNCITETVT